MILGRLFSKKARVPGFGPTAKAFLFCLAVKLPKLCGPELACPEKTFLRFPFARFVIAFGEEALAFITRNFFRRGPRDNRFPFDRVALCRLFQ